MRTTRKFKGYPHERGGGGAGGGGRWGGRRGAVLPSVMVPKSRKNLLLTAWLALPILVFAGMVAWIFVSKGRPKAMEAVAVGPGSGDTGGANALGEWLAGRSPNLVERANIARRQGQAVDPFWWPGGTRVVVDGADAAAVSVGWIDPESGLLRSVVLRREDDGRWAAVLRDHRPAEGALVFVSARGMTQRIRDGVREVVDDAGGLIAPMPVAPMAVGETASSQPLTVELPLSD